MRLLWFNLALMLSAIVPGAVLADSSIVFGKKVKTEELAKNVLELSRLHFDQSLVYLFTSAKFAHQEVEKPGMAKYLRELSDIHWKEGIDTLKKYFQRSGILNSTDTLTITASAIKPPLPTDPGKMYANVLDKLHLDSEIFIQNMTSLTLLYSSRGDGDWMHYFEEKLESEHKRKRELMGHLTNVNEMKCSSLAIQIFDSYF